MKRNKTIIAIIISVFFIFGLSGCGLISKTPEGEKKTAVASVNGVTISKGDYQKRLDPLMMQYESAYGSDVFTKQPDALSNVKDQLLQQMIQEQVMLQKAKELNISVDDKTVNTEADKQIADSVKQFGSKKAYEDALKAANLTAESYKASLTTQLKTSLTLKKLYDNITSGAKVTDQDVTNYYYTNQYNYTEKPDTMNVSHILLKSEGDAKRVATMIKAGMKFEDAAKKYGTDGTKDKGGLLGDIPYNTTEYDKDFVKGAIATPTGKVSAPVKTQFGFHLIKINSRHEYKVKPLDAVKGQIKTQLLEDKKKELFNTAYTTWEKAAKIEQHPEVIK